MNLVKGILTLFNIYFLFSQGDIVTAKNLCCLSDRNASYDLLSDSIAQFIKT